MVYFSYSIRGHWEGKYWRKKELDLLFFFCNIKFQNTVSPFIFQMAQEMNAALAVL